jgi:hypothetical protein
MYIDELYGYDFPAWKHDSRWPAIKASVVGWAKEPMIIWDTQ